MSGPGAYEPLHPGSSPGDYNIRDGDADTSYHGRPEKTPLTDTQSIPNHSSTSLPQHKAVKANEEPKIVLKRNIGPLLLSLLVHIIPTASTIAIVSLSILNVY